MSPSFNDGATVADPGDVSITRRLHGFSGPATVIDRAALCRQPREISAIANTRRGARRHPRSVRAGPHPNHRPRRRRLKAERGGSAPRGTAIAPIDPLAPCPLASPTRQDPPAAIAGPWRAPPHTRSGAAHPAQRLARRAPPRRRPRRSSARPDSMAPSGIGITPRNRSLLDTSTTRRTRTRRTCPTTLPPDPAPRRTRTGHETP